MQLTIFLSLTGIIFRMTGLMATSNQSEPTGQIHFTGGQVNNDNVSTPLHSEGNTTMASKRESDRPNFLPSTSLASQTSFIALNIQSSQLMETSSPEIPNPSQTEMIGSSLPYQQFATAGSAQEMETNMILDATNLYSFSAASSEISMTVSKTSSLEVQPSSTHRELSTTGVLSSFAAPTSRQSILSHSVGDAVFPSASDEDELHFSSQQFHIITSNVIYPSVTFETKIEPELHSSDDQTFLWTHFPVQSSESTPISISQDIDNAGSYVPNGTHSSRSMENTVEMEGFDSTLHTVSSVSSVVLEIAGKVHSSILVQATPVITVEPSFALSTTNGTGVDMEYTVTESRDAIEGYTTESYGIAPGNVSVQTERTPLVNTTAVPSVENNKTDTTVAENASIPFVLSTLKPTSKPINNVTVASLQTTTTQGKSTSSGTTVGMKTKILKNITTTHPIPSRTTTITKIYAKPTVPTKYPLKPDNTPTPKKIYTTDRTMSKNEVGNETPWRPPVYVSAKIRMTISELCAELHDFSTIILRVLANKLGEKAFQYEVVVLEELQCMPDMGNEKYRRDAEVTVNFFLVDPRRKYDMEVTAKLADLILESGVDVSGTAFDGKIVAFKVHGVADKVEDRVGETRSEPPAESNELSAGLIALVVIASVAAVVILIIAILQLMVCRRRMGMKKMRYAYGGSRPSLECHSIVDSIQLTGITTFSEQSSRPSFAYYNPALNIGDPNKDFSSNPLDGLGIEEMLEEPETIEDEFLMLPNVMPKLSEVPIGAEDKNRYANVIPLPATRVQLMKLEGEEHSEYINANFIRGYGREPRCYIATQAPLEDTRGDFWRMIWEQQSRVIIMLTDLEEQGLSKCAEYWPNTDGADRVRIYGDYEIILQRREVTPRWIQSTMILKHLDRNLCREIQHYWLTCWPEQGIPDDAVEILRFLLHVRPDVEEYVSPAVVHCSPGTGRTGTLLALDMCMRSMETTETVDILATVHMLRQDRAGAVQTQEQYFFIYQAMLEYAVKFCNSTRSYKSSLASLEVQHH